MILWAKNLINVQRNGTSSLGHLHETMNWLERAADASPGGGVSAGYSLIDGWLEPYPETTGYIIPTLYDFAAHSGVDKCKDIAVRLADWEVGVQMSCGAVQAGVYQGKNAEAVPAVFNTGQVILGWCRAYIETSDPKYLSAAIRAADWLIKVQANDGAWRFASSETETDVHAYDVRTAWSLLELYEITQDEKYLTTARRNLVWTLAQQHENGWFDNNAFFATDGKWTAPFTHNIAYVMEGFQEAYRLVGDGRYLSAYSKTAEKLLRIFELRRRLAGDFDADWKSSADYSCLTGSAQIAGVWLRHFETTGDVRFLNGALKLGDHVKSTQNIHSFHGGIRGGVQGSFPITGKYTPFIFPNWAAKFLADTLMLEERIMAEFEARVLNGEKMCS